MEKLKRARNEHLVIMKIAKHRINWQNVSINERCIFYFILFHFNVCLLSSFFLNVWDFVVRRFEDKQKYIQGADAAYGWSGSVANILKQLCALGTLSMAAKPNQTKPNQIQTIALKWITMNNLRTSTRCHRQLVNVLTIWFNATAQTKRQIYRFRNQFSGSLFWFSIGSMAATAFICQIWWIFADFSNIYTSATFFLQIRTDNL